MNNAYESLTVLYLYSKHKSLLWTFLKMYEDEDFFPKRKYWKFSNNNGRKRLD